MRRRFLNNIKSISSGNDYYSEYFTIEALEDGLTASLSTNACEYRIDDGGWNTLSASSNTPSVNKGQKISFKITNPTINSGIGTFTISKKCNLKGNIMSLLYGDNFEGQIDLSGKYNAFYWLFFYCETIVDASELILPATILANDCYSSMFEFCIGLTTAPQLPATRLADYCYNSMFNSCTSLTTAPELPATTLAECCYNGMFYDCSNLNYIKMLATDISANYCLNYWVSGVASSGTFVKNVNMNSLPSGKSGIPDGWTVEDYDVITNDPFNGHEYVDLGLPSGTLWATSVIGGDNPLYFQWGDTEGWTAEQIENGEKKFDYYGSDYKFGEQPHTKYNSEDGKRVLDLEDDAAHVHMGGDWHMPTYEQWNELKANTTSTWTTQNGVNGRLFTSKMNGESLFVPSFGYVSGGSLYYVGSDCYVWSSSVYEDGLGNAWYLYFYSSIVGMGNNRNRAHGFCVLGVVG